MLLSSYGLLYFFSLYVRENISLIVRTTRKAGSLGSPIRACYSLAPFLYLRFKPPCRLTRSLLLKELSLLRTERISILFARHLIEHQVTLILITDILTDGSFVQAYCADVIPYAPESPIAILILQLGEAVEYH